MRVLVRKNPRVVALEGPTHCLTFRQRNGSQGGQGARSRPETSTSSTTLKPKVVVHLDVKETVSREKGYVPLVNRNIFGCLGLITIAGSIYLAVITSAVSDVASPLPSESVNRIFAVEFLSITNDEWDFINLDNNGYPIPIGSNESDDYDTAGNSTRSVHPCWELRKLLLNGSFYYSNNFDLTSLVQNRGVNLGGSSNGSATRSNVNDNVDLNHDHYQEQYMWNNFLMEELLRFKSQLDEFSAKALAQNHFLTTAIRGFAKTTNLGGNNTISIISKQSWKRAGTRFLSRGIDDNGDVANFVESEFIFYNPTKGLVFAFTQIRGSVPAFWEQDLTLINPKITVTRSIEATQSSFDAHFTEICAKYNACHIINLLSKTKSLETELSRRYVDLLKRSSHSDDLLYSHFDFHAETKPLSGGFAGATKILPLIHKSLEQFGWFDYDIAVGEVVTRQDGVLRVNCLDCLDRTNLIEQVICQTVIEHIMRNQSDSHGNSGRDRARLEDMITRHNDLWADNGDAISQIYTGTNALKSSFSRSGKMNLAGALSDVTKSVSRMYQNTFVDSKKQSTIDILLGKDGRLSIPVQIFDPSNEYVTERLRETESTYTSYSEISMFTGTFNVNAAIIPSSGTELKHWLFPAENDTLPKPDIYGIGLQELIELNAGSILAGDASRPILWAKAIQELLNSEDGENYILLRTELMTSMCLFLFVKQSKISYITQVSGSSKKTGLGGITANKGACAVRFNYGSTSIALVTSHLAAGVNATIERQNDYMAIMQGLAFTRNLTLNDHDNIVWFGDLNYRINLQNDRCRSLITHGAFDELQEMDQLKSEQKIRGGAFGGFEEARILFFPTYKFDKGTSQYDSSEKQRVPSWTDRVLYRSKRNNDLVSLNYNSVMNVCVSDHKPVYSTFQCKVKFVDEKKKEQLSMDFYNAFKADNADSTFDTRSLSASLDTDSRFSLSLGGATSSSGFASDTLSDLNLLDVELTPPKVPPRSRTSPATPLARKAPPVPASRRVPPPDLLNSTDLARTMDHHEVLRPSNTPTPPPRKASQVSNPHLAGIGLSSAPLTPKSYSPISSRVPPVEPASTNDGSVIKPLKPTKPVALSATKIDSIETAETGQSSNSIDLTSTLTPKNAVGETQTSNRNAPPPPPSRANTTRNNGISMTMSDWKPLVPK